MPNKKMRVELEGNSTQKEVHEKVINRMKDCHAFVFLSIKEKTVSSAFSVNGATPEQMFSLSRNLNDEAIKLIKLINVALDKHENENIGKVAPRGVS